MKIQITLKDPDGVYESISGEGIVLTICQKI